MATMNLTKADQDRIAKSAKRLAHELADRIMDRFTDEDVVKDHPYSQRAYDKYDEKAFRLYVHSIMTSIPAEINR